MLASRSGEHCDNLKSSQNLFFFTAFLAVEHLLLYFSSLYIGIDAVVIKNLL